MQVPQLCETSWGPGDVTDHATTARPLFRPEGGAKTGPFWKLVKSLFTVKQGIQEYELETRMKRLTKGNPARCRSVFLM